MHGGQTACGGEGSSAERARESPEKQMQVLPSI